MMVVLPNHLLLVNASSISLPSNDLSDPVQLPHHQRKTDASPINIVNYLSIRMI